MTSDRSVSILIFYNITRFAFWCAGTQIKHFLNNEKTFFGSRHDSVGAECHYLYHVTAEMRRQNGGQLLPLFFRSLKN